jgi:hypothetical protein
MRREQVTHVVQQTELRVPMPACHTVLATTVAARSVKIRENGLHEAKACGVMKA